MLCVVRSVTEHLNRVTPAARQRSGVRHKEPKLPMQIHRIRHARGFTVLPNAILQDRRLSYTARGLLADLLSRPDGWSEDSRRMADSSPQGRLAVAKALRELAALGYYRVIKTRRTDGTFVSEAHVYDTPQRATPAPRIPGPGRPPTGVAGANPVKDLGKPPSLPAQRSHAVAKRGTRAVRRRGMPAIGPAPVGGSPETGVTAPDGPVSGVSGAVALLYRVIAPEPRLRLGAPEAAVLAPLVEAWLERGYGQRDLAEALLGGLPERVHGAQALLRDRLTRKLPPPRELAVAAKPRWSHECATCGRPTAEPGICRACAGLGARADETERAQTAARGIAQVRAALLGHRSGPLTAAAASGRA